jgi:HtrA serine peptidase 2
MRVYRRVTRFTVYGAFGIGLGLGLGINRNYSEEHNRYNFISNAAQNVMNSVVNIRVDNELISTSGSGMFIENNMILTNAHVIGDASQVTITTADGAQILGNVHAIDSIADLAVIKLNSKTSYRPVKFGSMSDARVGDWVCSIGCPFGLQNTVTAGVISSLTRESNEIGAKERRVKYLQTDCVIHSGSSGGPLVNLKGQVIGINTTRAESEGISFAIRTDTALDMIKQLVQEGRVTRPYLGLHTTALNAEVWKQLKGKNHHIPPVAEGILVTQVVPASPAQAAGLEKGDVIVRIEDSEVKDTNDLISKVGLSVGKDLKFTIRRSVPLGRFSLSRSRLGWKSGRI